MATKRKRSAKRKKALSMEVIRELPQAVSSLITARMSEVSSIKLSYGRKYLADGSGPVCIAPDLTVHFGPHCDEECE